MIRPGDVLDPRTVSATLLTVTGSMSGKHAGKLVLADDKKTLTYTPSIIFIYTEKVTVKLNRGLKTSTGAMVDSFSFWFKIMSPPANRKVMSTASVPGIGDGETASASHAPFIGAQSQDSLPSNFPGMHVDILDHPAEGQLFLVNFDPSNFGGPPYPSSILSYAMIMNDSAHLTYAKVLPGVGTDSNSIRMGY